MHRSRLGRLVIDCQTDNLEGAVSFWGAVLALKGRPSGAPEDSGYVVFEQSGDELEVEVQRVDHPSRVHLDIETDDIEAEVRRLEGLGAKRVTQIRDWWVLEAPTGQRFCVVKVQRADFAAKANRWD